MFPRTLRHHHRVESANTNETAAIKVKGSAELMVKRIPERPALTARAAVLDVA
jgi:hypothetical protein